jgi:DNA primase
MFPIADGRGRVIAFGGRVIGDGEPKYLNSPDTPLFHKGRVLYGFGAARRAAADRRRLIVVEGYMDVIALSQAGFAETVAPLGTALTEDQLGLAWRAAPEVVLCFDGDAAGQRAALRAIDRALPLVAPERTARVVTLPQGEDPDSLVAKGGAAAFEAVVAAARPLSEAIWGIESQSGGFDTPEARARLIDRLRQWARKIADRTLQQQFEVFFDDRVAGLTAPRPPAAAGRGRFASKRPANRPNWQGLPGHVARPPDALLRYRREQVLMAGLVNHAGLVEEFADDLGKVNLSDPKLDKLRQEILKISARDAGLDVAKLARHLMDQGFAEILQSLSGPEISRVHGPFTRADAPADEAREGVRQALMFLMRSHAGLGGAASAVSRDRSDGPIGQG